jgi:hypothetical protein
MLGQAAGQPRDPSRRFTGLCDGRVDEQNARDGCSPFLPGRPVQADAGNLSFDKTRIMCTLTENASFPGGMFHVRDYTQG